MVRGLHPDTTQEKLTDVLKAFGPIEDVRLIRNKITKESRGFAFVDFATVPEAVAFVTHHKGVLHLDGRDVTLDYSVYKDISTYSPEFKDWLCEQCKGGNFARRNHCYYCGAEKSENALPCNVNPQHANTDGACPVLVVRNLNLQTTEETLYNMFSTFAPLKEVRLIREKHTGQSRGFCFIEYHTVEEATYAYQNSVNLLIDDKVVRVAYAKQSWERGGNKAGNVALEQAQWALQSNSTNQTPVQNTVPYQAPLAQSAAVSAPYQAPATTTYQAEAPAAGFEYDESSGYYYNAQTGYYYDSSTGYYYDSNTSTYYYYDTATQTYVVVPDSTQTEVSDKTEAETEKEPPVEENSDSKPPSSTDPNSEEKDKKKKNKGGRHKKITEEMDRWSKKNQELKEELKEEEKKKEEQKAPEKIKFQLFAPPSHKLSSPLLPSLQIPSPPLPISDPVPPQPPPPPPAVHQPIQLPSTPVIEVIDSSSRLVNNIPEGVVGICLLCKCGFPSSELLSKHKDLSSLHKRNIEIERAKEIELQRHMKNRRKQKPPPKRRKKRKRKNTAMNTSNPTPNLEVLGERNIGNQMMRRMGWKEGEGLGKDACGIVAPIEVSLRTERAGLGSADLSKYAVDPNDTYQQATKKKARARLESLMRT